jgi:hypothetical protein
MHALINNAKTSARFVSLEFKPEQKKP